MTKIVFVDGLNEIPARVGAAVLRSVDNLMIRIVGLRVIVADRLVRRGVKEGRWQLARVEPLSAESQERAFRKSGRAKPKSSTALSQQLFDWAFFLAKAIDEGAASESGSDALLKYLFRDSWPCQNGTRSR